jgi:hypothetical protein
MNKKNRIEGHPNYVYKSGLLEGQLLSTTYANIPGITVTDPEALAKYIDAKLDEIHNNSVKYNEQIHTWLSSITTWN